MTKQQPKPVNVKEFNQAAFEVDSRISKLHEEIGVLAWAAEELWHFKFSREVIDDQHEKLSLFPVVALQLLAQRTAPLIKAWEEYEAST